MKDKIIFLVGPTAVGKTEIAVSLARKINAEIISCDSMQVYKKMDIITSKPARALRKLIPHHLIDVLSPIREYNVSRYRKDALKKIKAVLKKGKVPLFVGGTGLYMSILIDGIFEAKTENPSIRKKLYKVAEDNGSAYLYNRLARLDSEVALKIHPNDTRRIVRALEVYETTGKPISQFQKQRKGLIDKYVVSIFCLHMERDKLNQRIHRRLEQMFRQGLIEEVRSLLKLKLSKTAHCAIGIKELKGFFCGAYDLENAKKLMRRNTQLYAKRQLTWFRKDKRINWVEINEKEKPKEIAMRIWKKLC
ncbi:MAG: tRNA (adenosine(37)-N6)-dimethylallyltransferase MiaA [Candidatus Omnitrophica bacterium]|nr:tRNA (adenosine(37)-N6)-dimethylallyltransferase MiaA [Candidatus Omnitrophota bacterium]